MKICNMKPSKANKKTLKAVVKQSITQALLQLMQTGSFENIRITDITKRAGVSRVSFYRNFESKEDVLIKYLHEHILLFLQRLTPPTVHTIFVRIFEWANEMGEVIDLLYRNNLSYLLLQFIRYCCGPKPELDNSRAYHNALVMGVCFGALDEWIQRGRTDSPETMADCVKENLLRIGEEWDEMAE